MDGTYFIYIYGKSLEEKFHSWRVIYEIYKTFPFWNFTHIQEL